MQGWTERCQLSSLAVCVNPAGGFNCYWEMPFRRSARITLENRDENPMTLYYQVNYTLTDVPEDVAYFHAQWRRSNPLPYKEVHTLLDGVRGHGHYVGTYLAWGVHNNGWWGEGEIKFFMDGDGECPTICGTGTEDYFGGAWDFEEPERGVRRLLDAVLRAPRGADAVVDVPHPAALRDVPLAHHGPGPLRAGPPGHDPGARLAARPREPPRPGPDAR